MKKLIIISLLIIACSKGEEKVEMEDNRPLIERLKYKLYANQGEPQDSGTYLSQGYSIYPILPNQLPPLIYISVGGSVTTGLDFETESCRSIFNASYTTITTPQVPIVITQYEVLENSKNTYQATWIIENLDNTTHSDSNYTMTLTSNNDEKLSVSIIQEYNDWCTGYDANVECISADITNRVNFYGDFIGFGCLL